MDQNNWKRKKEIFAEASELPAEERAAFLDRVCGSDTEMRADVDSLLLADGEAGEFIMAPALVEAGLAGDDGAASAGSFQGRRIGAYEIVRELGRGGMGTVFLALRADAEFDKQVAIKIVNRGMDTESILRRFLMERQILANLEHPHIARFLDGGSTEDGLPYFVMEYVEGEPITDYCDRHHLNITRRLRLFQLVCDAVQHAHQNLIVHRDIKPRNILVTRAGQPRLLDFGIAKLLSPERHHDLAETESLLRLMTPAYASPEQVCGLPVTTASDVYSLGVVLYQLLSGRRPLAARGRSPEEMLPLRGTEEPPRPSLALTRAEPTTEDEEQEMSTQATAESISRTREGQVDKLRRRLAGDLDNIVLKALRHSPERRYPSVRELSEDIRRHLQGLPVSARPDTFSYRASKFAQRHRAAVAISLVFLITLISTTSLSLWQAHIARRERTRAEQRVGELRKLSNSLLKDVSESLETVVGSSPAQRMLANKSLEYLDSLARDDERDVGLLGELSLAYGRVRRLQLLTLRDTQSAMAAAQKAVTIERRREQLAPGALAVKHDLVNALGGLGEVASMMGQRELALQVDSEMVEILAKMRVSNPRDTGLRHDLANSLSGRAELFNLLERPEEARGDYSAGINELSQAIQQLQSTTTSPQVQVETSSDFQLLGSFQEDLNELPEAEASYRLAGEIAKSVYREHPEIIQAFRNTSSSQRMAGEVLEKLGDERGAIENYRQALSLVINAYARDPTIDRSRYGEIKYGILLGTALYRAGERAAGVATVRRAMSLLNLMQNIDKDSATGLIYSFENSQKAAQFFSEIGHREEALDIYRALIVGYEKLQQQGLVDAGLLTRLAELYSKVGDVYSGFNGASRTAGIRAPADLREAHRWYQKAFDAWSEMGRRNSLFPDQIQQRDQVRDKLAKCDALPHS